MTAIKLPQPPKPAGGIVSGFDAIPAYTADQLRADRLAVAAAVIEACAAKFAELMENDPWSHYSVHVAAIRALKIEGETR